MTSPRAMLVSLAYWAVREHAHWNYAEIRPIPVGDHVKHLPVITDCSGFVTLLAKWAGLPDPNGNGYSGEGYTGTLLSHLPHISKQQARRGDLVVFGPGTGYHVVMLMQSGLYPDPLVASHGQQGDPNLYHISDERNYFGWGTRVTYLRIIG